MCLGAEKIALVRAKNLDDLFALQNRIFSLCKRKQKLSHA